LERDEPGIAPSGGERKEAKKIEMTERQVKYNDQGKRGDLGALTMAGYVPRTSNNAFL
jgi:hypothetical protein